LLAFLRLERNPQGILNNSILEARLAMLPFAALFWVECWSIRFLPIPLKNPLIRGIVQVTLAALVVGNIWGQMSVYRSLSGIRGNLNDDNVFFALFLGEFVIGLCLIFSSAFELRRKVRNEHPQ
jgi:hypothetical protein